MTKFDIHGRTPLLHGLLTKVLDHKYKTKYTKNAKIMSHLNKARKNINIAYCTKKSMFSLLLPILAKNLYLFCFLFLS